MPPGKNSCWLLREHQLRGLIRSICFFVAQGTIGSLEIKRSDKHEGAEAARAHVLQLDEAKVEQLEGSEEVLERLVLQEDLDPRHRANGI